MIWDYFSRELHQEGLEEAAGGEKPYLNPAILEVGGYNYLLLILNHKNTIRDGGSTTL